MVNRTTWPAVASGRPSSARAVKRFAVQSSAPVFVYDPSTSNTIAGLKSLMSTFVSMRTCCAFSVSMR